MPILYLIEAHVFSVVLAVLMLGVVVRVLSKQRRPSASLAWILAIILVPYIAIPAYFVFGGRKLRSMRDEKQTLHHPPQDPRVRLLHFDHPAEDVLTSEGVRPPSARNRVEFVADGVAAFETTLRWIEEAKHTIFIETYVFHADEVTRAIVDALAKKAAEGVEVRLLIDSYGSLTTPNRFLRPLIDAGGHVARFLPMLPVCRNWSLNLRNHRKLLIVDGRKAWTGGMNLGAPYLGPSDDSDRWIDTIVHIEGPAVSDMCEVFCSDWNFASQASLDSACAHAGSAPETDGDDVVQIVASGPDVAGDPLYEAVLASIHAARERIWMVTPYFAPGEELFRALLIQARIGRDVRLLMPAKSNHLAADLVRGPYLRQLAEAGGTVLLHDGPMIHAKNMVFDDTTAVTGTSNFDLRSLYLNFEVAVFAYNRPRVREIAAWMQSFMDHATAFDPAPPRRVRKLIEEVSFLFSPLL